VSVGGPLLAGGLLDRPSAGIVASLGGFTGQYALDVPYRRRGVLLVWIGLGFVATAVISTAIASAVIAAAVGLGAIAAVATFLCRESASDRRPRSCSSS
jgi:hypothetical protein